MEDRFDVVVVGAGPAGAAAALAARRANPTTEVLLLDRADFPRDKTCGDGIAPHAVDVLTMLGATRVLRGYRPTLRLRVTAPSGATATGTLRRPDWVIPREVFDARLVDEAQRAGATLCRHRVRTIVTRRDGASIDGEIHAKVVIAADGANSTIRRALGFRPNPPTHAAVAIRGYAPATDRAQHIVMDAANWPSYAWRFPVGDGTANVGYGALRSRFAGTRADLLDRMEHVLGGTGVDHSTLRGHSLPLSAHRPPLSCGPVLLAGDAASMINPLSGEGIYYALASGALAGRAAASAASRYRRAVARLLGRHFRHTAALALALDGPALAEAGIAAASRSPAAFDDLCELTLGRGTVTPRLAAHVAAALVRQG